MTTVLTVLQEVCVEAGLPVETAIASSPLRHNVELCSVARDCAVMIAKACDWRELTSDTSYVGNGIEDHFPRPGTYDRMTLDTELMDETTKLPLRHIESLAEWRRLNLFGAEAVRRWIMIGDRVHIRPAIPLGGKVSYYHQSKYLFVSSANELKQTFTADSDVFRLDPTLWKFLCVAEWKERKGVSVGNWRNLYSNMFNRLSTTSGGKKELISISKRYAPVDSEIAYPGNIVVQ